MNDCNPVISIAGRSIGSGFPPFVVAEISASHHGSLKTALKLIDKAKKANADAVKLQTYTPDTITLDCDRPEFIIEGGLWDGRTLYELYEEAHTPWEWHKPLFDHARKLGITIFSSPFDNTAVDLLEDLNAPAYKIASFEAIDLPLIKYVAGTGKPMIISTGMADLEEIGEAIEAAREGGCQELAILHCVSGYPAPAEDYNLRTIPDLIDRFGLVTGLSDHTLDNTTAIAGVALGASIVEKHFTLDRSGGGPDDSFSLEPKELATLCRDTNNAWSALGDVDYGIKSSERGNIQFRRSLYFVRDIQKGEIVKVGDIRSVRPGFGLPPKEAEKIIGKMLTKSVLANTPVSKESID
jgi:N-acetylneuraminate synthase